MVPVALRKESVDRNGRALARAFFLFPVALRKESVDRNIQVVRMAISAIGRSPQGERG